MVLFGYIGRVNGFGFVVRQDVGDMLGRYILEQAILLPRFTSVYEHKLVHHMFGQRQPRSFEVALDHRALAVVPVPVGVEWFAELVNDDLYLREILMIRDV